MPMTLISYNHTRKSIRVISLAMFSFLSISACDAKGFPVGETKIFGDRVTLCYSEPFQNYAVDGQTGFLELDSGLPALAEMNTILAGYKRMIVPAIKPNWADSLVTGSKRRWKRLCNVTLPKGAAPYSRTGRWMVDPDYDSSNAEDYPSHPLSDSFSLDSRYWFVGEKLVHVEIKLMK